MKVVVNRFTLCILFLLVLSVEEMAGQIKFEGRALLAGRSMGSPAMDYLLPPPDPFELEAAGLENLGSAKKSVRFAIVRDLDISPLNGGEWTVVDGTAVWRVRLISPGAYALGLNFSDFRLAPGSRLFIYDGTGASISGAFDHRNNRPGGIFTSAPLPGDEVIVELQSPAGRNDFGSLTIESLSHAFLPVPTGFEKDGRFAKSGACEIDINCTEGDDWQTIKRSVCRIYTTREYCTGVLVNNTSYDGKPYVLTAEHCVNTEYYANRTVFVFNYESPVCFGGDGSVAQSVSGATLVATGDSLDFSLLLLQDTIPDSYSPYLAGWDLSSAPPASSRAVHHPQGDVKKISGDYNPATVPTSVPSDLNDYIISSMWRIYEWDFGSTEGGSSGSPLFNMSKKLVGTLTGGLAYCGDSIGYDALNDRVIYNLSVNRNDFYTRISYVWDHYTDPAKQLRKWLDPLNTGATSVGGFNPLNHTGLSSVTAGRLPVYPNPAQDLIRLDLESFPGNLKIIITDLSGRQVYSGNHSAPIAEIDISDLQPGLYLISGHSDTRRFCSSFVIAR
ncbi:MAG: T9SS type A sorting domain-containing protein [Bacteroidota bacterium]